jgi:hypothetical protein
MFLVEAFEVLCVLVEREAVLEAAVVCVVVVAEHGVDAAREGRSLGIPKSRGGGKGERGGHGRK